MHQNLQFNKNAINQDSLAIGKQLLNLLEGLLATGDWRNSMLLQTLSQQLKASANEINEWLSINSSQINQPTLKSVLQENKQVEQYLEAYISLYQTEGNNQHKWALTLKLLDKYCLNRPIYRKEEHVQELIRTKTEAQREAYVVVRIKESDILFLNSERKIVDRLGYELLTIRPGAISSANIVRFVHGNDQYNWKEGQLVIKDNERKYS